MALYTETLAEWLDDGNALPEEFAQIPGLENAFLGRYVTREIGFETPWLFKVKLNAKAAEIVPLYVGRVEALNAAEAAVLTGSKQSKTVNGKTLGTVTEMPINATTAQPNTVTQTDEADADISIRIGSTGGQVMPGVHDYGVATVLTAAQLIGNRVLFGIRARQVELPRSNNAAVKFRVYSYVTGIKVCLIVNGEEIDITDAFEATLSSDENMYTTTQQIVKALNFAVGGTLAAVKSYNRQGAAGALGSLATTCGGGIEQALDVSANVGRNPGSGKLNLLFWY